jgi:hypothetical protein
LKGRNSIAPREKTMKKRGAVRVDSRRVCAAFQPSGRDEAEQRVGEARKKRG